MTPAGDHHRAVRGREQVENLLLVDRAIDQDDRALACQFGGVASFPLGRDGRHVRFSHAKLQQQIQQRVVRGHGALPKPRTNRRTAEPDLEPRRGPLLLTRHDDFLREARLAHSRRAGDAYHADAGTPARHRPGRPDRPDPLDPFCFAADGQAAGPHRVARAAGPRPEVLHAERADVRQQPHRPVYHPGFGQHSLVQQALSCRGKFPVTAIEAGILKCLLHIGIPARRVPQEVVESVETRMPGGRRLLELIGKFH